MASVAGLKGITGLLSTSNSFRAPSLVTQDQAGLANKGVQAGIDQQQSFVNAVNAQNGLGNQANVFAQQQGLANQFQGVADGTGPNPALAQLNQTTGANVANQAALMAGQRGASANAGLVGRQAAMQGGALQQQAVGQGATLQAQQQLAALSGLQQQQQNMGNLATTQVGQQQNALTGLNQFAQGQQSNLLGAVNQQNQINAGITNANTASKNAVVGSLINAGGQAAMMAATGGASAALPAMSGSTAMAGQPMQNSGTMMAAHGGVVPGKAMVEGDSPKNDTVPAKLSPGEIVIPRSILEAKDPLAAATAFLQAHLGKPEAAKQNFASGGEVPATEEQPGLLDRFMNYRKAGLESSAAKADAMYLPPPPVEVEATGPQLASNSLVPGALPSSAPAPMSGSLMPEAPAHAAPNPFVASSDAYMKNLQGGIDQQRGGIMGEAKAQGELGQKNALLADQAAQKLQVQQQDYQKHYDVLNQQRDALQGDIANARIDPNRFLGKMDTSGKVMTGIGLLLSGIGSGMAHQDNMAMKFLQTQIDHDIDAQKADLGKKENLLSANMRQFGNLKDAQDMTRVMMNDTMSKQIEKNIAEAQSPMAKARGQQALGQLQSANAATLSQIAMNKVLYGGAAAGSKIDPASMISLLPPGQQEAANKELTSAMELKQKRDQALSAFGSVADSSTLGYKLANPRKAFSGSQSEQLNTALIEMSKDESGKSNPLVFDALKAQYKPKQTDTDEDIKMKQRSFAQAWNQKANFPSLDRLGINPMKSSRFDPSGKSRIQEGKPKL